MAARWWRMWLSPLLTCTPVTHVLFVMQCTVQILADIKLLMAHTDIIPDEMCLSILQRVPPGIQIPSDLQCAPYSIVSSVMGEMPCMDTEWHCTCAGTPMMQMRYYWAITRRSSWVRGQELQCSRT